jgi:hypothetical protein
MFNDEERRLMEAVDKFGRKMKNRLLIKYAEGYRGWDDVESEEDLLVIQERFRKSVEKGNYIDVANLAMMLDLRKENTS